MQTNNQQQSSSAIRAAGEMAELTRNFDWTKTPVGNPDQWPKSLLATVNNLLYSKFPMFLWWGDDLIQFYNDAYCPSLGAAGKHPAALGQKGADCWQEIWPVIYPLMAQVKATGEATWMEDQLIPILRNGKLEDVYWTFSYSLVLNDEGEAGGVLVTCIEMTEKLTGGKRLEEANKQFRETILQAPFAVCVFRGPDYVIEIANKQMFKFWGKTEAEVMHRPLFEAIPEAKAQGYEKLMTTVLQTGKAFSANELQVLLPRNGKVENVFIDFAYHPLQEPDGSISGIMATATDVTTQVLARHKIEEIVSRRTTELAEANSNLQKTNVELNRSNQYLEEFAHAASHDLKEPIRKIRVFTNQLKDLLKPRLEENELSIFDRVEKSAIRMGTLVDDLLMYSHVSQQPLEKESIDLNVKLARVLEDLELEVEKKAAVISVGQLPVVKGYRRQLQQLFQNLISNALKYSKADQAPRIDITADKATEDGQEYHVIAVKDNGIGFEQQYAERIFRMFSRLHGKAEYSGTGVGLSIAKKVAENHNGFIRAESVPGEGSTFSFFVPAS